MKLMSALLISIMVTSSAIAHDATGTNGGKVIDAGSYHLELVTEGSAVNVYVTDSGDKPATVEGFKGTAILIVAGKPQRIELAPAGANRLAGTAALDVPQGAKGAVQIQTPAGASVQGKF